MFTFLIDKRKDVLREITPNKKIVHLAFYSKKARVRKKNRNRILKDLRKE